jgi:Ca2+-binding RTX toxin-like protein
LFNKALSSADAQAIYLNDINPFITKPVAWWKFDATSGNIAADSAGHNDGILQNNPTPTIGKLDDGLSFDGVNDYVQVADNPALNFGPSLNFGTGDFSINTWVKTTDNQGIDVILDKHVEDSGPTQGYVLYNYDGKLGLQLADGSGSTNYISNVSITDGKWHQVSVTIDRDNPNGGQWYVDGDQVETFNPTGRQGSLSNSKPLTIGKRSDSSVPGYFKGSLDEVQLFNKSLSATEVKAIYQTTPTGNETLEIPQGALVGTEDSDTLFASVENHTIYGLGGNDTIYANEGNNTIYGGTGRDTIYASSGNDLIDGGADNDTIYANEGKNTIYGGTGDDLIYAGSGSDTITGGDGNDIIYAGAGDDLINGGLGNDTLWLGGGHDTVTLESGVGFDTINSFQLGQTTFTLGSGLKTSDLTINDGTSGSEIYAGSDLLAVVSWTQASTINNNLSAVFV